MFNSYSWKVDPEMSGNDTNMSAEVVSSNKRRIEDYYEGLAGWVYKKLARTQTVTSCTACKNFITLLTTWQNMLTRHKICGQLGTKSKCGCNFSLLVRTMGCMSFVDNN